jgi:transposase
MTQTRREFTLDFKREAVALLESSGRSQMQIAAELGIQLSMLRNWRAMLKGTPASPPATASSADLAAENARLKRELARVKMERDVLKRAIGIFAEMPQ